MTYVILDHLGKVWELPKDLGEEVGYHAILLHIVRENHLPNYYGRRAKTLIVKGEIVCRDLDDRARAYVEEREKLIMQARTTAIRNHPEPKAEVIKDQKMPS